MLVTCLNEYHAHSGVLILTSLWVWWEDIKTVHATVKFGGYKWKNFCVSVKVKVFWHTDGHKKICPSLRNDLGAIKNYNCLIHSGLTYLHTLKNNMSYIMETRKTTHRFFIKLKSIWQVTSLMPTACWSL